MAMRDGSFSFDVYDGRAIEGNISLCNQGIFRFDRSILIYDFHCVSLDPPRWRGAVPAQLLRDIIEDSGMFR